MPNEAIKRRDILYTDNISLLQVFYGYIVYTAKHLINVCKFTQKYV